MHDASSEQAVPSRGHSERTQFAAGIPSLRQKLGIATLVLLTVGGGALRAEEASDDIGLLFGSEMATLASQALQELQVAVNRTQAQLSLEINEREEAFDRRDEAQQLKVAREQRLETKARSYQHEIIMDANPDRLTSIAQEMIALKEKVAEAEVALNRAESEIASLNNSIAAGTEASQQLQRKIDYVQNAPALALAERAPNVVRYLVPYSSLVVNRRNLILLLKPGVKQLDLIETLQSTGLRVVETWSAGSAQAVLVERNREAGELRVNELVQLEESLRRLTSTAKVQQILADPLLFGADPYFDSDVCIKKVLATQPVSPQDPCIRAAVRLRLPISIALLRRPKVKSQLVPVNVGVLDVGFTTQGNLISNSDEHGDVVRRVLDFALGEWQTPRPLNITWILAAAPGKKVTIGGGVVLNGVLLPKTLRLLETLDKSGVRVTNVSLGSNEFLLEEKPLREDLLGVRVVGYQQLIDGYAELSESMFVASAAGNDASCWKGYKAIWSSPLNASQVRAIQIVAQLKPSFAEVDNGSNFVEPSALLMTPSGTTKRTCPTGPVAQVQTSYATPYVSAVATILAAILPQADGLLLRTILRETTKDYVPDALAAALCALNRSGIDPWQALADTNNDGTFGPDDRAALVPSAANFGAIYSGADLNGDGVVGGSAKRKIFGVDLSDGDLMDIAAGLRTAPVLPTVCQ